MSNLKGKEPNFSSTNTKGAAAYLNVSESYLNRLRCVGGGPKFYKYGRKVSYTYHDLDEYAAEHRFSSTTEYQQREEVADSLVKSSK